MKKILLLVFLSFAMLTAKSQTFCDSLDIKVIAHPFYDSLLAVHVTTHSQQMFSYPAFMITNGGDTLAIETPDFFAGPGLVHIPAIRPGKVPGTTLAGDLHFYIHMFDSLKCTWQLQDVQLCPDSCEEAVISLGNLGSATFTGTVNYQLKNSKAQVVKIGVFHITNPSQSYSDTVCLYPDQYTLHISQIALTPGGNKFYSVNSGPALPLYPAPFWVHNSPNDTTFTFDFYKRCMTPASVKNTTAGEVFYNTYVKDGQLKVTGKQGQQLGRVFLYSIEGRVIARETVRAAQFTMDIRHLPAGIYIVQVGQQNRVLSQKIYIGNE